MSATRAGDLSDERRAELRRWLPISADEGFEDMPLHVWLPRLLDNAGEDRSYGLPPSCGDLRELLSTPPAAREGRQP